MCVYLHWCVARPSLAKERDPQPKPGGHLGSHKSWSAAASVKGTLGPLVQTAGGPGLPADPPECHAGAGRLAEEAGQDGEQGGGVDLSAPPSPFPGPIPPPGVFTPAKAFLLH